MQHEPKPHTANLKPSINQFENTVQKGAPKNPSRSLGIRDKRGPSTATSRERSAPRASQRPQYPVHTTPTQSTRCHADAWAFGNQAKPKTPRAHQLCCHIAEDEVLRSELLAGHGARTAACQTSPRTGELIFGSVGLSGCVGFMKFRSRVLWGLMALCRRQFGTHLRLQSLALGLRLRGHVGLGELIITTIIIITIIP